MADENAPRPGRAMSDLVREWARHTMAVAERLNDEFFFSVTRDEKVRTILLVQVLQQAKSFVELASDGQLLGVTLHPRRDVPLASRLAWVATVQFRELGGNGRVRDRDR